MNILYIIDDNVIVFEYEHNTSKRSKEILYQIVDFNINRESSPWETINLVLDSYLIHNYKYTIELEKHSDYSVLVKYYNEKVSL
jgi:hypothetical protein